MARRYWVRIGGRKVYMPSLADARAFAADMANRLGQTVRGGYDDAPAARKRTMRRNPDPGAYVDTWREQERGRAARLAYNQATKARRLAKGLRNRSGAAYEDELAHARTAKFVVVARNRKEAFTLYRPSRRAAEALGGQFEAAGYQVSIRPA